MALKYQIFIRTFIERPIDWLSSLTELNCLDKPTKKWTKQLLKVTEFTKYTIRYKPFKNSN
jgi:hypothetical protein